MTNEHGQLVCDECKEPIAHHDAGIHIHGRMTFACIAPITGTVSEIVNNEVDICMSCAIKMPLPKGKILEFLNQAAAVTIPSTADQVN